MILKIGFSTGVDLKKKKKKKKKKKVSLSIHMGNVFQDVYIHMAKSSFELFFPLWGFSPLFPSQRSSKRLSSACASHWTLPFLRLDSLLIEKGPDILTSRFHPNRLKTKPARENQRIRLQRQHCLFLLLKAKSSISLGSEWSRDTAHQISSKSVEN